MQFERIKLEFVDRVAFLTLNHPETLNATSIKMITEMREAMKWIEYRANGGSMPSDDRDG
jgi:enoyl-CoA hydratase/carnithine racemase